MPDKTTPHIERAARAIAVAGGAPFTWKSAPAEFRKSCRDAAVAAFSTALEPSEAEIIMALRAFGGPYGHQYFGTTEMHRMRAALIAAARVRVGE